jgi:hypothetical protein
MEDQMADDIDKWAAKRLQQWISDVLGRFEMADIPLNTSLASTGAILMMMAAKIVAVTNVSENEAGETIRCLGHKRA